MPHRIQLRRSKGWRLPKGAVVVARPSMLAEFPDAVDRAMFGYGHFPDHGRDVVRVPGRDWPWTPETCSLDECPNEWIDDGRVLVCTGCGLDVT